MLNNSLSDELMLAARSLARGRSSFYDVVVLYVALVVVQSVDAALQSSEPRTGHHSLTDCAPCYNGLTHSLTHSLLRVTSCGS